jgi:phenylpropionate dioxygenase-like ring-hydroxylating dioxygenase large terminal subunit
MATEFGKTTFTGLGLGNEPVPIEPNVSAAYFEREREKIFKRSWLCVGRVEDIPRGGDFVSTHLDVLGARIVVVRGADGQVRAFYDICRHRGNRLTKACKGNTHGFVCGFHGWAYDLAGNLARIPDQDQFHGIDKSDYGLKAIASDVWNGFIFINVDPARTETLEEFMAEVFSILDEIKFETMRPAGSYAARVNVNWKVFMDVTQEAYHVPFLHKNIVPDSNTGKGNPFCRIPSFRLYERHRSSTMYANPDHKPTAAESLAYKYGPTVLEPTTAAGALPSCLNPDRVPSWGFDSYVIFPNLIIHIGNGWYITHQFWPVAVDRIYWEFKLYMSPATTPGEKISQEFSKVLARDLTREDLFLVEQVQSSISTGVLTHMPLSDQEILLRHGYKVVDEWVQRD